MERQPGDKFGPYEIVSAIGKGGMGEVWKARDTRLNRDVAIKFCANQFSDRFLREARAIAALNHPNICTLFDIGPDYLVMEHIEGEPPRGPLGPAEAVRLALGIAAALEAAHGKGITHRDLKPANILVTQSGVKLLDFGLALVNDSAIGIADAPTALSAAGAVMGTVAYMSPEQAQGKPADARSDIFSFGLVLYELLSGRQAFAGNSAVETMAAIIREEPTPLDIPSKLAEIVMRCLRKPPASRFQTMAEVKAALEQSPAKPPEQQPSIAVLPFANMSADKDQEYFSDGLAEEIINALAQIPGLKVTARTSAFAFRGKEQDISKIAEALKVRTILEGSVRKSGNRIRITAQLINAADGYHLWSQRYDREMADVFAIQDEISQAITRELQLKLSPEAVPPRRYEPKIPAWEAYLKGRYHLDRLTPESRARSRIYIEDAIALDPGFGLAHALRSRYFVQLADWGDLSAHEAMPQARAAAKKALEVEPSLPEAHAMLGWVAGLYDYDWKEAGSQFQLAVAHEPVSPMTRTLYGYFYLARIGRFNEAIGELEQALLQDPMNVLVRSHLAICLQATRRNADASRQIRQMLDLDENFWFGRAQLAINSFLAGNASEAVSAARKAYSLAAWNVNTAGLLAGLLALNGESGAAEEILRALEPGDAYGAPIGLATYCLIRGDTDRAAEWMHKAIEQRHGWVSHMLNGAFNDMWGSSPRRGELLGAINLPEKV